MSSGECRRREVMEQMQKEMTHPDWAAYLDYDIIIRLQCILLLQSIDKTICNYSKSVVFFCNLLVTIWSFFLICSVQDFFHLFRVKMVILWLNLQNC